MNAFLKKTSRPLAGLALATVSALAASAVPTPGYLYPSSIRAGTNMRVIMGGQGFGGVTGAAVSGGGVKVTRIVKVPRFPRAVGKTQTPWVIDWMFTLLENAESGSKEHRDLPPEALIAETDWADCAWWAHLDEHDELELQIVARDLATPLDYPQATPALDYLLLLDVETEASAKPGRRDLVVYDGGSVSAPRPFFVTSDPHVAEPYFTVPARENFRQPLPGRLHLPNNFKPEKLPVTFDGQVWPGETDVFSLDLERGTRLVCRLTGRELTPYLGDAVPGFFNPAMRLKDAAGNVVAAADDFKFLPDPILACDIPSNGVYRLEIFDNLYRGRSDFVYMVHCVAGDPQGPFDTARERAFFVFPPPFSHDVPADGDGVKLLKGVVNCPGRKVRFPLKVESPGPLEFELYARRTGSPLDGVVQLRGPLVAGVPAEDQPLLAEWDDVPRFLAGTVPQGLCDPTGTWDFHTAGDYALVVADRSGEGGEDYDFTLAVSPLKPSFEVYAEHSAFLVGQQAAFKARVVRKNGFTNAVHFVAKEGVTFSNDEIPAGEDTAEISLTYDAPDVQGIRSLEFSAVGEVDGREKRVRVTPCEPSEQAFAYTHLVPQSGFLFVAPEN